MTIDLLDHPPSPARADAPARELPARDRRFTPSRPDLADESLRGSVEAERFVAGSLRRVVAPSASLRRRPEPDAPLDTEALMGEVVTVYEEEEGWAWGQLAGDGYVGYLPAEALGQAGIAPDHRVAALRTFLYPGPNLKLPPLGALSLGAEVTVTDIDGDYARTAQGGFIFAGHLVPRGSLEVDFVTVAERFVGVPYLWGGKTSLGLDCSGLIQVSLAACGVAAPRDSDQQMAALGDPVDLASDLSGLQRGDLVFWRGHVGVMVDGARLLHANGHHMAVAVEPLRLAEERIRLKSFGPITGVTRLAGARPA